jgi:hypothetical protein
VGRRGFASGGPWPGGGSRPGPTASGVPLRGGVPTSRAIGGASDGEDAAQSALLKVFSRAADFDAERDALSWALGIAANECRTLRQRSRRRSEAPGMIDAHDLADQGRSPEDEAIARDLAEALHVALAELPRADVDTLAAVLDGSTPDVPAATFRKRVQRGMSRLRAIWRSKIEAS